MFMRMVQMDGHGGGEREREIHWRRRNEEESSVFCRKEKGSC